jgi:dipeptidyl aminopeptidase/acylaminoacyl peptidase
MGCALLAACAVSAQTGSVPVVTPATSERTVEETSFRAGDGAELRALLSVPKGRGPFPVVVTLHGGAGGRDYRVLRGHAAPEAGSPTVQMLNGEPWAVYAIGYRAGAILGREEEDVLDGIRAIKADPRIDPRRVAVFGGSHGGQLALRAAIRASDGISCVAAGSPWMTDPVLHFYGDPAAPPLSTISPAARAWLLDRREVMLPGLSRNTGAPPASLRAHLLSRSIEAQAGAITVPTLFLTSRADVQVPHVLVEPTIARMRAAGRPVEVLTVNDSLHGFYWGREGEFGARAGTGAKTAVQRAEEEQARTTLRAFLGRCLQQPRASRG